MANAALEALGDADPYLRARLLLRLAMGSDDDPRFDEAMAIAQRHGFEDVLAVGAEREAWHAVDEGRLDDANALREKIHVAYARSGAYDWAASTLRGAGFDTIGFGRLDEGFEFAERCFDYAMSVHLAFQAQLALMDMAGIPYARRQFERCESVLARFPDATDFRGDLFRMWMSEERGDGAAALRYMVDPARGGNVPTAMGQIHAASAGILYRLGKVDAAREAMHAWDAVQRSGWGEEDYAWEGTALVECLVAEADDALIRKVQAAFDAIDRRSRLQPRFSTLQGRALAPLRGAVLRRLGRIDEARQAYEDGLAWCEQEGCARDAKMCRAALAAIQE